MDIHYYLSLSPRKLSWTKDPFVPFVEGLVELPDGVRVLSIIDCEIDKVKIGMKLELVCYELYKNEQGQPVIAWKFKAV